MIEQERSTRFLKHLLRNSLFTKQIARHRKIIHKTPWRGKRRQQFLIELAKLLLITLFSLRLEHQLSQFSFIACTRIISFAGCGPTPRWASLGGECGKRPVERLVWFEFSTVFLIVSINKIFRTVCELVQIKKGKRSFK